MLKTDEVEDIVELVGDKLVTTKVSAIEIEQIKETDKRILEELDLLDDDLTERQHYEEDPWIVRLTTPNTFVEKISYAFENEFARELAIKLSKENPTEKVFVTVSARTRVIYSNGEVEKDFEEIPYLDDGSVHFKYFERRWIDFKV